MKNIKKVLLIGVLCIMATFSFVACGSEYMKILKEFDLSDPKIIWEGSINDDFTDDSVIVVLRKTSTYPELELKHFKLNNAEGLEYMGGVRPPDYFFTPGNELLLINYRQIVLIHLTPQGKEKIIETIRELEKLDFVKSISPNNVDEGNI